MEKKRETYPEDDRPLPRQKGKREGIKPIMKKFQRTSA